MTRRCTLPEPWLSLVKEVGGVQKVAELFDTGPRMIHAWAHHAALPHWRTRRVVEDEFAKRHIGRPSWKGSGRK